MKIFLTLIVLCSIMLAGCSNSAKVETPPWSEKQVEQFNQDEVNTVPLAVLRF